MICYVCNGKFDPEVRSQGICDDCVEEFREHQERHSLEIHQEGLISIEQDLPVGALNGHLGVKIAEDGRVWICVNHQAYIRFTPPIRKESYESASPRRNYKGLR